MRRGNLRASDADRDQIIDRLRRAAAEGRLAVRELEHRVAAALRARTFAELDATVRDLPGERRSASRRAMRTVQNHPGLLLVAIPVALAALATLVVMTMLWSILALIVFLLGHRRRAWREPWTHTARHRFGPIHDARGGHWS